MEAKANHDFRGSEPDELAFRKMDILKVLRIDQEQMWFKAELHGNEGLVPGNYIELLPHPWYHATMTRQQAESTLSGQSPGSFMVRNSETQPGDFSLSVKTQNGAQHYRIWHQGNEYYIWTEKRFSSINKMLDYYQKNTVAKGERLLLKTGSSVNQVKEQKRKGSKERRCTALYDYDGQDERDLSFRQGDTITVVDQTDENWWTGRLPNGREGLFPVTYVQML